MGVFDLIMVPPVGPPTRQRQPNWLSYRCHDRLLTRILPPHSGELSWELGFSEPRGGDEAVRPNAKPPLELGARLQYTDLVGNSANEGGAPADDARELAGYARQTVSWTVSADSGGAVISTGWHQFNNQVTWDRHGDWTPPGWDPAVQGPYLQPGKYAESGHEPEHGYPWQEPLIHPDWWQDNEFTACATCASGHDAWSLSGYPVGVVFVVIKKAGSDDELFAAAELIQPLHWRMGASLWLRYRGRFG